MMHSTSTDEYNDSSEIKGEPIIPTNISYLRRHFLWPKEGETRLRYSIKALVVIIYYSSVGACCVGYIFDIKHRNVDIGYEGEIAAPVALICQSVISLLTLIKQQTYSRLLEELATFNEFGKPKGFEKSENKLKIVTNSIYFGTVCGLAIYGLVPIFEISRCKQYNELHNIHEVCGLYAPIWSILHFNRLPMIYIYFIYQATATLLGMPAIALIPVLAYGLHEHMATRIEHVKEKLKKWRKAEKVTRDMLREFIRHHQYVIRLMKKVDGLTSGPLCVHVFLTSTIITLILHQILNLTWRTPGGPIMHMLIWLMIIYINSLGGQRVIDESLGIADEIYNHVDWYKMDVTIQKDLLLIICRAQKALVVSTGAFGCMDLKLLLAVVKGLSTFCVVSLCQSYLEQRYLLF